MGRGVSRYQLSPWPNPRDVSHLASRTRLPLAVDMHGGSRNGQPLCGVVHFRPNQVHHFYAAAEAQWTAKWPPRNRPDVLLELRDRRAVDGPVARIVNARGDLVDQYCCVPALADDKHFHRKHADIVKGFGDAGCDLPRLARERRGHFRGHARDFENMIAMLVFRRLEAFHVAVTRTGDDYRNLSLEIDEAFQDTRRIAYRPPGCDSITTFGDLRLALAVVTELA